MDKKELEIEIKKLMSEWVRLKNETHINKIRYAGPKLDVEEYGGVMDAIFDDWWSGGKFTMKAEELLAEMSDRNYALLTSSGSAANLVLMSAAKELYFKDGDKILTLSCGFPTTVNPIIQNRLIPVFVDINLDNLNLSPEVLEDALKKDNKIKGVFIANTLGFKSQIKELIDIVRKYNVQIFFDNCDSYGTKYENRPIEAYGKASTYSFYVAHHLTMGEGGGISTNDNELHLIMRGFRNWGRYCSNEKCCIRSDDPEAFCPSIKYTRDSSLPNDYMVHYQFEWLGYNLKPTEMQSAMLIEQIKKLDLFTQIRKRNYNKLYEAFKDNEYFRTWEIDDDVSPFSFPFIISEKAPFHRKHLIDHLTRSKIECRVLFGGNLMKHPAYEKMIGVSQILTENDIDKIIESITKFLKQW